MSDTESANPRHHTGTPVFPTLSSYAWVPVLLLLASMLVLRFMNSHASYDSQALAISLNLVFFFATSLYVAALVGKIFLAERRPALLLLYGGALIWGASGWLSYVPDNLTYNISVTIHNTCAWLSAVCFLGGIALSSCSQATVQRPGRELALATGALAALLALVFYATVSGWLPTFFIQGQGGTTARTFVLASTIAMFLLCAALVLRSQDATPPTQEFNRWFSLAFGLLAVGLFGVMIQKAGGSPVGWSGRVAQYLGGVYLALAAHSYPYRPEDSPFAVGRHPANPALKYLVAVVAVSVGLVARLAFLPGIGNRYGFLTFYPAVIFTAFYGGKRAGLLATVLSVLMVDYFVISPNGSGLADPMEWVSILFFAASCMWISLIADSLYRAREELLRHQAHLDQLVRMRTAALTAEVEEREATVKFLGIVNEARGIEELVRSATDFLHRLSGCEAVGIRLRKGDDFPYFETRGFPEEFVRLESNLCSRDPFGTVLRSCDGYPMMECMCGNVIQGRFDPSKAFFTPRGTFWTNSTTELLATSSEADRQSRTRKRCNGEGYESMALMALRSGGAVLGLLQLNDTRPGRFTPEVISKWERLADQLANALAKTLAQESLRDAVVAADNANRAKSEFLARMSHELRTPLNGITGMIELALRQNPTGKAREYLQLARQSTGTLLEIINDILDLARIESGRVELASLPFQPRRTVHAVVSLMGVAASQKGVELKARVDPTLPALVEGDETRLRQVLVNLVGNAVKFTEKGFITISVERDAGAEPSPNQLSLIFRVTDTGIGIPQDQLESIFERFSESTAATHVQYGGTGLGLSISKNLVELMGGRISASSPPPGQLNGSVFTFNLAFALPALQEAEPPAPTPTPPGEGQATSLRILLAEDNPVNQLFGSTILEMEGHHVVVAGDGREALTALSRQPFDLILMDVQMPVMDGLETTRRIREGVDGIPRDIPIIALTANALTGDREKYLSAGMDGYISKPIEIDAIIKLLRDICENRPASC